MIKHRFELRLNYKKINSNSLPLSCARIPEIDLSLFQDHETKDINQSIKIYHHVGFVTKVDLIEQVVFLRYGPLYVLSENLSDS